MRSFDLLDTLEDLLISVQKEKLHPGEETHVKHLIYRVEGEIEKIKIRHGLGAYNAAIYSDRIAKSFYWVERDIFDNEVSEIDMAIGEIDYQYWVLIFLFNNLKDLNTREHSLIELIDRFIDLHKEKSLTFADVAITASGATRCKTNLRFAFSTLKEMGLIRLHEKDDKVPGSLLTFTGFFLAASILLDPDPKRDNPLTGGIPQMHVTRVLKLDNWLLQRIETLGKKEYFEKITEKLLTESPLVEQVKGMEEVFYKYATFCSDLASRKMESPGYTKEIAELREFLTGLEKEYNLLALANGLGAIDTKLN